MIYYNQRKGKDLPRPQGGKMNTITNIATTPDYQRGYFEAREMIGTTYMSSRMEFKKPDWYNSESKEYKKGFAAGIQSLQVF